MATATPNTLINSISGRLGNAVFYLNRGRQCLRLHVVPRNPNTEAQRTVRRTFRDAVISWQSLTGDEKYSFRQKARFLNMSGYNLFISQFMKTKLPARGLITHSHIPYTGAVSGDNSSLRTLSPNRIPSVSAPFQKADSKKRHLKTPESGPG